MKKLIALFVFVLMTVTSVQADDMAQYYYGEQPPSQNLNQENVSTNIEFGQLIWDMVGRNNTNGFFTNLTVTALSGMYLQVGPASNNTRGSLYQIMPTLTTPFGNGGLFASNGNPIPADATQIFKHGMINSVLPAMGPVPAPNTSGQSVIDLVECQVSESDSNPTTTNFVSSTNVAGTAPIPQYRVASIVCQVSTGSPASSPVAPSVDSGWVAVGTATIPYGATSITSITQATPFNGFLPAGTAASFVDTSTNGQVVNATKNFAKTVTYSNGAANLYTGNSLPYLTGASMGGDGATNAGLLFNVAAGSVGAQFLSAGTRVSYISPLGVYTAGTSTYGPTAANVNGTLTAGALTASSVNVDGTQLNTGSATVGGVPGSLFYAAPAPTASPLIAFDTSGNEGITGQLTAGTGTYGTNANIPGTITTNLTIGACVQVNASHQLSATGGGCGLSSGTITAVTSANSNLTATNTSGAISLTSNLSPTFATATVGSAATVGSLLFGTDGMYNLNRSGNHFNLAYGAGAASVLNVDGGFTSLSSVYGPTAATVNGPISATTFTGSGANLTTGTVPLSALAVSPVTAVTASGNLASSGGATPAITISSAPTFSGIVTASRFNGSGAGLTAGTIPVTSLSSVPITSVASGSNVSVTGGSTAPVVSVVSNPSFSGVVNANAGFTAAGSSFVDGFLTTSTAGLPFTVAGTRSGNYGAVIGNLSAGSPPVSFISGNGSNVANIDASGGFHTQLNGTSTLATTNFSGGVAMLPAGPANPGALDVSSNQTVYDSSHWNGSSAVQYQSLIYNHPTYGLIFQAATGGINGPYNFANFTFYGNHPNVCWCDDQSGGNSWNIVNGDSQGYTAGSLNFGDVSTGVTALTLSSTGTVSTGSSLTVNGSIVAPAVNAGLTLGSVSAGNGLVNAAGAGALYLNYSSGTGGVSFCNGAGNCTASMSPGGLLTALNANISGGINTGNITASGTISASLLTAPTMQSNSYNNYAGQAMLLTDGGNTLLRAPTGSGRVYWENSGAGVQGSVGADGIQISGNNNLLSNIALGAFPLYGQAGMSVINSSGFLVNQNSFTFVNDQNSAYIPTYAQSFNPTSDRRLKENIKPLTGSMTKVMALRPVSFDWKSSHKHSEGLIAQDVEKIFPDAVDQIGPKHIRTINYTVVTARLIDVVQQQQKEIAQLKQPQQQTVESHGWLYNFLHIW